MIRSFGICLEIIAHFLSTVKLFGAQESLYGRVNSMRTLVSVFSRYGGLLGKIAQLLSLDADTFEVFEDCKPAATEESISYVIDEVMTQEPFVDKIEIEPIVYKSGSLGQVYKGRLVDGGEPVVLKIQFRGVKATFDEDFAVLDFVSSYLFTALGSIGAAISDIKEKTKEELDYLNEMENQMKMIELFKDDPTIHIPKVYTEFCTDEVIVMEEMVGFKSIPDYMKTATEEERSELGNKLLRFVMNTFYTHGIFYSDNHYGNFMVNDNHEICVLDFGCVNYFEPDLLEDIKQIHRIMLEEDKEGLLAHLEKMGIMLPTTSPESRDYCYEIFTYWLMPMIQPGFKFNDKYMYDVSDIKLDLQSDWGLPTGLIYLTKIPWGLYNILNKLGVTVDENKYML
jgi:predicted unusual protein kinase regulating ubiquinone biosynthesis (AarF/ABC1/UbiB family)